MRVVAITGGIGGAKLCLGLMHQLQPDQLTYVVNTGDDFEHFGMHISPDIDTLTYTLAAMNNTDVGWGRADESWNCMAAFKQLGAATWFNLGDRDLALHLQRSQLMREGATLTQATAYICSALGLQYRVLPMSDDPVRTTVHTPDGTLAFQHYFVRDQAKPVVTGFNFHGIETAQANPAFMDAIDNADAIVICPSNPYVSVDPVLNIPRVRDGLRSAKAPVVAISPIVGGIAIKGPTAKMMAELDVPATAGQVAEHYGDVLDGFILDEQDAKLHHQLSVTTTVAQTVMRTLQDRIDLAATTLAFCRQLVN